MVNSRAQKLPLREWRSPDGNRGGDACRTEHPTSRTSTGSRCRRTHYVTALDREMSAAPSANASGVSAPKIGLLVSDGTEPLAFVMPNLTGQPLCSATSRCKTLESKSAKLSSYRRRRSRSPSTHKVRPFRLPAAVSEPSAASMIVTQTPAPGQNRDRQRREFRSPPGAYQRYDGYVLEKDGDRYLAIFFNMKRWFWMTGFVIGLIIFLLFIRFSAS